MSEKFLCIHGHFYQPPREDPWLDKILPEGSAAPFRHWNERICRESYAPLAWARRMKDGGRIDEIINCYEWMSFNVGPTLFNWIERSEPELADMLIQADRKSLDRCGHGNAIAQVYHHVIMPLATEIDKRAEVTWAIADFESRFNRKPEGMWLAETACDTASLEVLAEYGIKFTLLAPRQAKAVSVLDSGNWVDVDENSLDIRKPYVVKLPSGKSISVFFYDGNLSQAVAFEGLLRDGENFWNRLSGVADYGGGLLSIGTDGETYGHHFQFGEMALAYVLSQGINKRDNISLINYGEYLEIFPPQDEVVIHENSSWSCYHGVERWRSDCGCSTGGHPDWNQKWRGPLRDSLQNNKDKIDEFFFEEGKKIFIDPTNAFLEYGMLLSHLINEDEFLELNFKNKLDQEQIDTGWALLSMQKWALASFASCGWFFDDLARLEPLNNMTFALRAIEIAERTGLSGLENEFVQRISRAASNESHYGDGFAIWNNTIKPRKENCASLIAQAVSTLSAEEALPSPGELSSVEWPGVRVEIGLSNDDGSDAIIGTADIRWHLESGTSEYSWKCNKNKDHYSGLFEVVDASTSEVFLYDFMSLPWKKKQSISIDWLQKKGDDIWHEKITKLGSSCDLYWEYEDYQSTQTMRERWSEIWSAVAYHYIFTSGFNGGPDLIDFLKELGVDHPDSKIMNMRIDEEVCSKLGEVEPDWKNLIDIIQKVQKIGLKLEYWNIQNLYWLHIESGRYNKEFGNLIGF